MSQNFNKKLAERKSLARLVAVQALYSMEVMGQDSAITIANLAEDLLVFEKEYLADQLDKENIKIERPFLKKAVAYVIEHKEAIDAKIIPFLNESWTMEKIGPLLASILRVAVYEITTDAKLAKNVVVSEYVRITSEFFAQEEIKFINAVVEHMAVVLKDNHDAVPEVSHEKRATLQGKPVVVTEVRNMKKRRAEILANASDGTPSFAEDGTPILTLKKKAPAEAPEVDAENATKDIDSPADTEPAIDNTPPSQTLDE